MSRVDWPDGFERTDPADRERTSKFQATVGATTKEIENQLRMMEVESFRVSTGSGGAYTKSNGMPKSKANPEDPSFVLRWTKDDEDYAIACDAYKSLRSNCRAVFLWLKETRLRSKRPVVTGQSEFATARLPPGEQSEEAVEGEPAHPFVGMEPHEVLDVSPDAPEAVVDGAFRAKVKRYHSDQGGNDAAVQALQEARQALKSGET